MVNEEEVDCPSTLLTSSIKKKSVLIPFTTVSCEFEKHLKNVADTVKSSTPYGSSGGPSSQSLVGLRLCFFGKLTTEGTEGKSASVTQTGVEKRKFWKIGDVLFRIS